MKMYCCGLVYSTNDPQTYWCIQKYVVTKLIKKIVNGVSVAKEVIYVLICKKNGCTKLELHRYASDEKKGLLEKEVYSGQKAIKFLNKTSDIRKAVPQSCPLKIIPHARRIPFVYGKAIDSYNQRGRYMSEDGWDSRGTFYSPVRSYFIEDFNF